MKPIQAALLAFVAASALMPDRAGAPAEDGGRAGTVTYRTTVAGREVAVEEAAWRVGEKRWRAEGSVMSGGRVQSLETLYDGGAPASFRIRSADTLLLEAVAEPGGAVVRGPSGERRVEGAFDFFLENLVWHHYEPLLRWNASIREPTSIRVLVPSQAVVLEARLRPPERLPVSLEDGGGEVLRWVLWVPPGLEVEAYAASGGRPFWFRVPAQGVEAVDTARTAWVEQVRDWLEQPPEDAAFVERPVAFRHQDLELRGTLALPKKASGPVPGVLIISGSGAQDRDGEAGAHGLYRELARALASRGFAVLRHDDRGAGESDRPEAPTTYQDLVGDSRAALAALRKQPGVDPGRTVIIGHSEGATTAVILAGETPPVQAVVLLAGQGPVRLDRLVWEQSVYQAARERRVRVSDPGVLSPTARWILERVEAARAGAEDTAPTDLHGYLREHLALDFEALYGGVRAPVLILHGDDDPLVLPCHAIEAARLLVEGGNPRVDLRIMPDRGHAFEPVGRPDAPARPDPVVLDAVGDWLEATLQADAPPEGP